MDDTTARRSRVLAGWVEPVDAFLACFRAEAEVFWLDSGPGATSGHSVLGIASRTIVADVASRTIRYRRRAGNMSSERTEAGSIFDVLRPPTSDRTSGLPGALGGGWVGWFGYEAGASHVGVPVAPTTTPDAALLRADDVVVFDHAMRTVTLSSADEAWLASMEADLSPLFTAEDTPPGDTRADELRAPALGGRVVARWDDRQYRALVEACQERIRQGDAYQLCLTNELSVEGAHDDVDTYLRLRALSPAHHGGFIRIDGIALLSSSPEQFLDVTADGIVTTKPIKGTRPRGRSSEEDAALREELRASDKEQAENLMIVDLMRNDLARVCEVGSVTVTGLHLVESYPQVHQLVSTVRGTLRAGLGAADAIEACFPAGSMTGAPKRSAMQILHGLEQGPRGVYAGTFGALWEDGAADLAMVIRSIVLNGERATIGTGGGITALSVPEEELLETRTKAGALLAALGIEGDTPESR
ncbi:anthranilate synthase component I family protein [Plantibacter sp. YIM 135347]|uniref:anthranilate synthase component I family protein n=1 Tax=Plantibacter sp. YIM 135347 TaxID=3423919 RepID=UPI003D33D3AD